MGGSNSSGGYQGDVFDRAAQERSDRVYAQTGDNFKSTEAAVAEYAKKAMYDAGSSGPVPNTSDIGGNLFDLGRTAAGVYSSSKKS